MSRPSASLSVTMATGTSRSIRNEVSTSTPSTRPASAALARPAPIEFATSATVSACGYSRFDPSGRVITGISLAPEKQQGARFTRESRGAPCKSVSRNFITASRCLTASFRTRHKRRQAMDIDGFMENYKRAWETSDENFLASLFTPDGTYRNTPFAIQQGHEAIKQYWQRTKLQTDIKLTYEVLQRHAAGGIAHWHTTYQVTSEDMFKMWAASTGTNMLARKAGCLLYTSDAADEED